MIDIRPVLLEKCPEPDKGKKPNAFLDALRKKREKASGGGGGDGKKKLPFGGKKAPPFGSKK